VPVPATGVNLTTNVASPQLVGTAVTFTAAGSGGSPSYQYRYFIGNLAGVYTLMQDWSAKATFNLPAFLTAGTYRVVVHTRTGTGAFEAQAGIDYTLN
jgi:hypothetical protein